MCKCIEPNCQDGHYPLGMHEDGEVEWGACPVCVVNFVHICDENNNQLERGEK